MTLAEQLLEDERDYFVAKIIRKGKCPFSNLKEGQSMGHCPLGFPGCNCADEIMLNEYLEDMRKEI
jgi:hypothetical protein